MRQIPIEDLATAQPEDLVTVPEAASLLGVTPEAVRRWVARERVGVTIVQGRQMVLLPQAREVEHQVRISGMGRPRKHDAWS